MKTEELRRYEMERDALKAGLGTFVARFECGMDAQAGQQEPGSAPDPLEAGHAPR